MMLRLLAFLAACCLSCAALLPLAIWWGGRHCALNLAIVAALCSIPAFVTLLATYLFAGSSPERKAAIFFIGTAVRMIAVLGGAALLVSVFPQLTAQGDLMFWAWVISFYLITLAWEVVFVVAAQPARASADEGDPAPNRASS